MATGEAIPLRGLEGFPSGLHSRLTLESGLVSRGSKGLCSPLESDGYVLEPTEWLKGPTKAETQSPSTHFTCKISWWISKG